jgi:4-nitrophenyl phosphatase
MESLLRRYEGLIIDLDGVVYLLNDPITGAVEAIHAFQAAGIPFVFLTNNSIATPQMYVERLKAIGVSVAPEAIVSSSQAVRGYLEDSGFSGSGTALVIGEKGLKVELEQVGVSLAEGEAAARADFVFVGWDRAFDFEKLKNAVVAIRNGARYIATNLDATYPTPEGLWPGAGSIAAAVTCGSGTEPYVCGKPNPLIVELALGRLGIDRERVLLVGDRLDTDIAAGRAAGVDTLLVLTGVSDLDEVRRTGIEPTHAMPALEDLPRSTCVKITPARKANDQGGDGCVRP